SQALRKVQVQEDEGDYVPPSSKTFAAWADEWLASLRRPRESTLRGYRSTVALAKREVGAKQLRKITPKDIAQLPASMRKASPATQRKHLRVLGSLFNVAVKQRLITRNPVRDLDDTQKPQAPDVAPSYFTDDELRRLWPALETTLPVYVYLHKIAV